MHCLVFMDGVSRTMLDEMLESGVGHRVKTEEKI